MSVFICTDHPTHYPVGCASVVVAPNEEAARALLETALRSRGLSGDFTLQRLDLEKAQAYVLCDGDY